MKKITTKITVLVLLIMLINMNLISQMSSASYEFKVQPGAFIEHKVTEASSQNKSGYPIWIQMNSTNWIGLNLTKSTNIRTDVTLVNNSGVFGSLTFFNLSLINTTKLDELKLENQVLSNSIENFYWLNSFPIYQRTTTKEGWEQQARWDSDIKVVGNKIHQKVTDNFIFNTFNQSRIYEARYSIQGGIAEFFSFIFLNESELHDIFSINLESQYIPGFETYSIFFPLLIIVIVYRIKKIRK